MNGLRTQFKKWEKEQKNKLKENTREKINIGAEMK